MDNSELKQSSTSERQCSDPCGNSASGQNQSGKYWQIGKALEKSLLHMYEHKLWTDVCFRCKDSLDNNTEDRILAHRNILAARSPFFEALLIGRFAQDEIELKDVETEIFDLVLRFVYSDETNLTGDTAVRVLEIAHRYQLVSLVSYCAGYLYSILRPGNACEFLELAILYNLTKFRAMIGNFIDDNAKEVLNSEEFLGVSQQCLTCILTGDTFYTDEKDIVERAMQWADRKCTEKGINVTGGNKRKVLGDAFFQLRMANLNMEDFHKCTLRKHYYTMEEKEDVTAMILGTCEITSPIHNTARRLPRKTNRIVPDKREHTSIFVNKLSCLVQARVIREIHINGLTLKNVLPYIGMQDMEFGYMMCGERNLTPSAVALSLYGELTIDGDKRAFQVTPSKGNTVTFKQKLHLKPKTKPYLVTIELCYSRNSDVTFKGAGVSKGKGKAFQLVQRESGTDADKTSEVVDVQFTYSDTSKFVNCIESVSVINIAQRPTKT